MLKKFMAVVVLMGALATTSPLFQTNEADAQTQRGHSDQIARLYRTILGRDADAGGLAYWSEILLQGERVDDVAIRMMQTEEASLTTSGDPIVDAYRWALGREPDVLGYAHWATKPPVAAVIAISDSPEHQKITDTQPPPPPLPEASTIPEGWVDAGHGVFVPPVLLAIRRCESTDNYTAANTRSSARGAYQFLQSSWIAYGHADRYGVPEAHLATPAQQDEAALLTWDRDGTRPWLASRHCWG